MLSTQALFVRNLYVVHLDPSEGRVLPFNCASAPLIMACLCNEEFMNNISVEGKPVRSLDTSPAVLRRLKYMKLYFYGRIRRL